MPGNAHGGSGGKIPTFSLGGPEVAASTACMLPMAAQDRTPPLLHTDPACFLRMPWGTAWLLGMAAGASSSCSVPVK